MSFFVPPISSAFFQKDGGNDLEQQMLPQYAKVSGDQPNAPASGQQLQVDSLGRGLDTGDTGDTDITKQDPVEPPRQGP